MPVGSVAYGISGARGKRVQLLRAWSRDRGETRSPYRSTLDLVTHPRDAEPRTQSRAPRKSGRVMARSRSSWPRMHDGWRVAGGGWRVVSCQFSVVLTIDHREPTTHSVPGRGQRGLPGTPTDLPLHVDEVGQDLVRGGDDPAVRLEATLSDDHVGEFLREIDVRHLQGSGSHETAVSCPCFSHERLA